MASYITERLREEPVFDAVDLLYCNLAIPGDYTTIPIAEQLSRFGRALFDIEAAGVHLIMIACNSFSVLYDRTAYASACKIPVWTIDQSAVGDLTQRIGPVNIERTAVVIFGTVTTVKEGKYQTQLAATLNGSCGCIVAQACPVIPPLCLPMCDKTHISDPRFCHSDSGDKYSALRP
eukprot:COSAG01_NODE_1050_length_11922_cov_8.014632_5_plen_177_part_00